VALQLEGLRALTLLMDTATFSSLWEKALMLVMLGNLA
jgi:hypothetical protein